MPPKTYKGSRGNSPRNYVQYTVNSIKGLGAGYDGNAFYYVTGDGPPGRPPIGADGFQGLFPTWTIGKQKMDIVGVLAWAPSKYNQALYFLTHRPVAWLTHYPSEGLKYLTTPMKNFYSMAREVADKTHNPVMMLATRMFAVGTLSAATIGSHSIGMPHAHQLHPPSLNPSGAPIPFPSIGMFSFGGSYQVLINKRPAARAGDLGLTSCFGIPPLMSIATGSSSVFIGGGRAARCIDVVAHCHKPAESSTPSKQMQRLLSVYKMSMHIFWTIGTSAVALGAVSDAAMASRYGERSGEENEAIAKAMATSAKHAALQVAADMTAVAMGNAIGKDPCTPGKNFGMVTGFPTTVHIGGIPLPSYTAMANWIMKCRRAHLDKRNGSKSGGGSGTGGSSSANNARRNMKNKANKKNGPKNNNTPPNNNKKGGNQNGPKGRNNARYRFKRAQAKFRQRWRKARSAYNKGSKNFSNRVRKGVKTFKQKAAKIIGSIRAKSKDMRQKAARWARKQGKNFSKWSRKQAARAKNSARKAAKTMGKVYAKTKGTAAKAYKKAKQKTTTYARWARAKANKARTTVVNRVSTMKNGVTKWVKDKLWTKGCPISVITGEEILELEDVRLRGSLDFIFKRTYRSGHDENFGMGVGWTYSGCQRLVTGSDWWVLQGMDGGESYFAPVQVGEVCFNTREKMYLRRHEEDLIQIEDEERFWFFEPFGDVWLVVAYGDRFNNHYLFERDSDGRWLALNGDHGRGFQVNWNEQGLIASLTVAGTWYGHGEGGCENPFRDQALAVYHYDQEANLTAAFDRTNACEQYAYRNHVLMQRTLKSGFSFYFEWDRYDIHARCRKTWGDNGTYHYQFFWDLENRTSRVSNALGHSEHFGWDAAGQLIFNRDGNGHTTVYDYDQNGYMVRVIDPLDRKTEYQYDVEGNVVEILDADGGTVKLAYHYTGKPDFLQDRAGNGWLIEYDHRGAARVCWNPKHEKTEVVYDRRGNPTHIRYADGSEVSYRWNSAGDCTLMRLADGSTMRQKYDDEGNLVAQIFPDGGELTIERDAMGRMVRKQFPDGSEQVLHWTANGDIWRVIDGAGRETRFEYAGLSQPEAVINADGTRVAYFYDGDRNLTRMVNEKGESMTFAWDPAENMIERVGFDGRRHLYEYDAGNQMKARVEPGQVRLQYEHDVLGRLTYEIAQDARSGERLINHYTYNQAGQLASADNEHRRLCFTYDVLGNLLETWQDDEVITYQYDPAGDVIGKELPGGINLRIDRDAMGVWTAVYADDRLLAGVTRDVLGREHTRRFGNGLVGRSEYCSSGRLAKQWVHGKVLQWDLVNERQYEYDPVGNLACRRDSRNGTDRFRYDAGDYLVGATRVDSFGVNQRFSVDACGNPGEVTEGNRLRRLQDHHYDYDARGNLCESRRGATQVDQTLFEYNALDQLVASTRNGITTTYAYDALGRRILKGTGEQETLFYWDGLTLLMEDHEGERRYFVQEPDSYVPLAAIEDDQTHYFHVDQIGTPWEVTNQRGRVVWSAQYGEWGGVTRLDHHEFDNPWRMPNQYYDAESGLHYNLNRYYDPGNGRFTTQDPIGPAGGLNAYMYAPNAGRWSDPLGLCKQNNNSVFTDEGVKKAYEAYKGRKGADALDPQTWFKLSQILAQNKQQHQDMKAMYQNFHQMPDHAKFTTAKNIKLTKELKHWIDYAGPRLAKKHGADKPEIWVHGGVVDQKVLDYAKGKVNIFVF